MERFSGNGTTGCKEKLTVSANPPSSTGVQRTFLTLQSRLYGADKSKLRATKMRRQLVRSEILS